MTAPAAVGQIPSFDMVPVCRTVREYRIAVGDTVTLRANMGRLNDREIADIHKFFGTRQLEIVRAGMRKMVVQAGEKQAWVPQLFLIPMDAPTDE